MTRNPTRGHAALRSGRWSVAGCDYFLTFCTQGRRPGLHLSATRNDLLVIARTLEAEAIWVLRALVIMPDHVHLLVSLRDQVVLADAVRLFKGRASGCLRACGLSWQKAYFDHRMRAKEDIEPVLRYMLNNPYRAGLLPVGEIWPGYYCSPTDRAWFDPLTDAGRPLPTWLL